LTACPKPTSEIEAPEKCKPIKTDLEGKELL
jgi:hypothetical protein